MCLACLQEPSPTPADETMILQLHVEHNEEYGGEQCFQFRVRMSTHLWRMRDRLANALGLHDADRVERRLHDRVFEDLATCLDLLCVCVSQTSNLALLQKVSYPAKSFEDTPGGLGLDRDHVLQLAGQLTH